MRSEGMKDFFDIIFFGNYMANGTSCRMVTALND